MINSLYIYYQISIRLSAIFNATIRHDDLYTSRVLQLQKEMNIPKTATHGNKQEQKPNTCMAATHTNLKENSRGSSSYLERTDCAHDDGQLGRNI